MPKEDLGLTCKYPPMNESTRKMLDQFFAPYNQDLEILLNRPLPWGSE
jgi:hypothetical protein